MPDKYHIRINSAHIGEIIPHNTTKPKKVILAQGLGKFSGKEMVQVGKINEELGTTSMPLSSDQEILDEAVRDVALDEGALRRGKHQIATEAGLWLPLEYVGKKA